MNTNLDKALGTWRSSAMFFSHGFSQLPVCFSNLEHELTPIFLVCIQGFRLIGGLSGQSFNSFYILNVDDNFSLFPLVSFHMLVNLMSYIHLLKNLCLVLLVGGQGWVCEGFGGCSGGFVWAWVAGQGSAALALPRKMP